jgi:hypothetical protein
MVQYVSVASIACCNSCSVVVVAVCFEMVQYVSVASISCCNSCSIVVAAVCFEMVQYVSVASISCYSCCSIVVAALCSVLLQQYISRCFSNYLFDVSISLIHMFQWIISYVSSYRIEKLCMRACETLEQARSHACYCVYAWGAGFPAGAWQGGFGSAVPRFGAAEVGGDGRFPIFFLLFTCRRAPSNESYPSDVRTPAFPKKESFSL